MKKTLSLILFVFISVYQKVISPLLPSTCRFTPSCSEYGKMAITKHGPIKGVFLTIKKNI